MFDLNNSTKTTTKKKQKSLVLVNFRTLVAIFEHFKSIPLKF